MGCNAKLGKNSEAGYIWAQTAALPHASCVALSKLLTLSECIYFTMDIIILLCVGYHLLSMYNTLLLLYWNIRL